MEEDCGPQAFEMVSHMMDEGPKTSGMPWLSVDAFMTHDVDMSTIPHCLTFMTNASHETVPAGMCVVDTAALIGCGGDRTLDKFIIKFGSETCLQQSNKLLKGVNADAPVVVQHQQWIDVNIAGQKRRVALHRLPNSDVPLLLGLPQLRELGAVIDLTAMPKPTIQFTTIGSEKVWPWGTPTPRHWT